MTLRPLPGIERSFCREHLKVVSGDALDAADVERAMDGHDAVLSALGGRPWRPTGICARAILNITRAMSRHGLRRIVAISTFGAAETRPYVGWLARNLLFGLLLRTEVADKEAMEGEFAATDLEWVVVRVGLLIGDTPRGVWRVDDDGSIRGMGKSPGPMSPHSCSRSSSETRGCIASQPSCTRSAPACGRSPWRQPPLT